MEDQYIVGLSMIFMFIVMIAVSHTLIKESAKDNYLKGQSDCLQGDIKITLVEFKDGERKWYYTNELKYLKEYTIVNPTP